jgi:hypothetical protein
MTVLNRPVLGANVDFMRNAYSEHTLEAWTAVYGSPQR